MENVCILFSAGSDNAGTKLNQGCTVKKTTLIQVVFLHSGVRRNFHTVKTQDTAHYSTITARYFRLNWIMKLRVRLQFYVGYLGKAKQLQLEVTRAKGCSCEGRVVPSVQYSQLLHLLPLP